MACLVKECWNQPLPGAKACFRHTKKPCQITVVAGPPCSGKSTWVAEHAADGDLIVDWDALMASLSTTDDHTRHESLLPFVAEARDAVLRRLSRPSQVGRAWVLTSNPDKVLALLPGATVRQMESTEAECLSRLADDPNGRDPAEAAAAIRSHYSS